MSIFSQYHASILKNLLRMTDLVRYVSVRFKFWLLALGVGGDGVLDD